MSAATPLKLDNLDKLFDEIKLNIQPLTVSDLSSTETINLTSKSDYNQTMYDYNYTYSSSVPTISVADNTATNGTSATDWITGSSNTIWATNTTQPVWRINGVNDSSNKIVVNGKNADIEINGISLMGTLRALEERLNILRPNQELEKEWDELRDLGDRYRKLEAELAEKTKMWDTLKSMPPPEID